ncbi:hypothetical protein [Nocardioides bizhenqiangii]|uniref:Uncharacterized protein n=1 Tax=Nocardioides bizhenqiangii TaxID=3095076 RepID=A0ABZ0ZUS7_9ACTN|nr:hypothetical protein [Nocardioides sp. HM61]WQQ27664.1 hypothetical protein SHK19_05365 [Nocardioides sp. HM61]
MTKNGKDIRYVTADGRKVTGDDENFDIDYHYYLQMGVDSDLIYMVRPLLDGDGRQQALASRFLVASRENGWNAAEAQKRLYGILEREGVGIGRAPHVSEAEFNAAWDELSGTPGGNNSANYSFGHSEQTAKEALVRGVDPDS